MGDSPAREIVFEAIGKENMVNGVPGRDDVDVKAAVVATVKPVEKIVAARTIKEQEADEPLLQENPHRFVLFPIKYHEVSA